MNRPIGGGSKWFSVLAAEGDDEKPVVYQRLVTRVVRINETRARKRREFMEKGGKKKKERNPGTSGIPMKERVFEVIWPSGERVAKVARLAKRLDTLEGKTVCELWDNLFRGDKIFQILEEELSKQYPGIKFVNYNVFGSTHGGEEKKVITALPSMLKEKGCDAVISAVGC